MTQESSIQYDKVKANEIPEFEALSSGHRACPGCAEMLALRQAVKALGPNTIMVSATGCMEVVTTPFPQTAWNIPWMHVAFENASAVGSGVEAARKVLTRKGRLPDSCTNIVIMGGDGGTSDIGFQSLSGALERGHNFLYLCFDNEGYMNTGVQRSSATPEYAWTTTCPVGNQCSGKTSFKKDLPGIMAAHEIPYVATASPGHPMDLMNKVRKGAAVNGPAFIHIFSPCPTGWRMAAEKSIEVAKLAVKTNIYPLYEIIHGKYILRKTPQNPPPVSEYFKIQGRFKHLSESEVNAVQKRVNQKIAKLIYLASDQTA
ncbi:MAG: pyruvate synthase subunit PorB [Desulfovermiculus sp.]|nr:pyruvate synthase subunit PorB [Desulfovermiculus sp.]